MTKATTPNAGRWRKGESGNPAGRPPGTGEVAQLRAAIASHVPAVITRLVKSAKAGDVAAARLLLERVLPPMKPSEEIVPLSLPDGTVTDQGRAVLSALSGGRITPGQAAQLLASLGSFAQLTELAELKARLAAVEARRKT